MCGGRHTIAQRWMERSLNPYPARLEDLHQHLAHRYGQTDREATELLLAASLPCSVTGQPIRPWVVIETDYPSRDTADAWFSFGGSAPAAPVMSLSTARVERPRMRDKILTLWIDSYKAGSTGLFVDTEWRSLTHLTTRGAQTNSLMGLYGVLMAKCIRLRVAYPKGRYGADSDRDIHRAELARLVRRVLDNEHRTMRPCVEPPPRGMYYWCELLQKLSTIQNDWDVLTGSLAAIVRARCTLYNDPAAHPPDWTGAERMIRDMVNASTGWIVEQAIQKRNARAWDTYISTGYNLNRAWNAEIRRLRREGVIDKGYLDGSGFRKFKVLSEDWAVLMDREQRMFA